MPKLGVTIATLGLVIAVLAVGFAALPSNAADHLDGPIAKADGRLDLTDVYAFQSPTTPTDTVLIMGVDPVAGIRSPYTFHPDASYDFKIDTNGDAKSEIIYRLNFSQPNRAGAQTVTLHRILGDDDWLSYGDTVLAVGRTGTTIRLPGGGKLIAGIFDDPFFFDLAAFRNNLQFCPGGKGTNFFAGLNIVGIVLEVPSSSLGTKIGVWARTKVGGRQIDRMGRPAINTVFEHDSVGKDSFNSGQPVNDKSDYRGDLVSGLKALGNDDTRAGQLADFLLPDILTFDTTSTAGFPNGRRLQDDVIDIELNLITNGAVKTDCVGNDSAFTDTFPYLAGWHP